MADLNSIELRGLRAIEVIARRGSLRAAAQELGVTPGAISQRLLKAEDQLGILLFERTPTGLVPTEAGSALARHLSEGFASIAQGLATAQKRSDSLELSVIPVFAGKWLMPRLHQFSALHPDITVNVEATVALADPRLGKVDACIRIGKGPWPGLFAKKLFAHRVFPVCAPKLAERLALPQDILRVPVIREPAPIFGWHVWLGPYGLDHNMLQAGPVFSDASLCLDAARAGQGIFLAWDVLVEEDLAAGRLVAPYADRQATGLSYWLILNEGAVSPQLAKFRSWLFAEIEKYKSEHFNTFRESL
jgi:DNA-binding transcriptional LysR family regulator